MGILREPTAWIVILVVILLFGAKRLPDVARGVGRSMRIFKAETEGLRTDGSTVPAEPPAVAATPAPGRSRCRARRPGSRARRRPGPRGGPRPALPHRPRHGRAGPRAAGDPAG